MNRPSPESLPPESGEKASSRQKPGRGMPYSGIRNVGLGVTVPTMLAATVIVATAIGYYLDKWLETSPWFLLVFLVLGIVAGLREMIRLVQKMEKDK